MRITAIGDIVDLTRPYLTARRQLNSPITNPTRSAS